MFSCSLYSCRPIPCPLGGVGMDTVKEIMKLCKYIGSTTMDQIPDYSLFPPKNAFLTDYKTHSPYLFAMLN